MRLLFVIDLKNYDSNGKVFSRPSARAIIIRNSKIFMVHSLLYDYYKFPGGGIEEHESNIDALIRETAEEAGLLVIKGSIREYGYVHRVQEAKDEGFSMFVQDNFYYLCDAEDKVIDQKLDDYEDDERFTLELVDPLTAMKANRNPGHDPRRRAMVEREARVLEMLIAEGYFH